jgi:hypothetical protein
MKPHRGTLILVLGILGLILCGFFTGIPAWIMGNRDLKDMDAGVMDASGRDFTKAGRICGLISVPLSVISVFILAAVLWALFRMAISR